MLDCWQILPACFTVDDISVSDDPQFMSRLQSWISSKSKVQRSYNKSNLIKYCPLNSWNIWATFGTQRFSATSDFIGHSEWLPAIMANNHTLQRRVLPFNQPGDTTLLFCAFLPSVTPVRCSPARTINLGKREIWYLLRTALTLIPPSYTLNTIQQTMLTVQQKWQLDN